MQNENEIWRPVHGFEGLYDVSNLGNVRTVKTNRIRKPSLSKRIKGYRQLELSKNGKVKTRLVHRLVCQAFCGEEKLGFQAAHLDGNCQNNLATNLKWVSKKENSHHREIHGTTAKGETHGRRKLTEDQVKEIRHRVWAGEEGISLSLEFEVHQTTISQIKLGKIWTHV